MLTKLILFAERIYSYWLKSSKEEFIDFLLSPEGIGSYSHNLVREESFDLINFIIRRNLLRMLIVM